jgi:hypothetical protein
LAGALEPCGCVKEQLGGMDHFGALVRADETRAPAPFATLAAGPLFFMDPELAADKRAQEIEKAKTIASCLGRVHLGAIVPARDAFAAGSEALLELAKWAKAPLVAANLTATGLPLARTKLLELGGIKLGVVGVSAPDKAERVSAPLKDVQSTPSIEAVGQGIDELKRLGAHAVVVVASVGRGEAKRIADRFPELLLVLVGSPSASGDTNTSAPPAEQVGSVLIVETANHLQTVGVLELFAPSPLGAGPTKFSDGTGIERMRKRDLLTARIDELRKKVASWELDKSIDRRDIEARKSDITRLEQERDAIDQTQAPMSGNFYKFAMKDIRNELGTEAIIGADMLEFYKKVNDANKLAFKDRMPTAPPKGQPSYVGVDACANCHEAPKKVWDQTSHAHAYATLERQFKEANLDCVSCHVTGYDKPGGSTVTHVDALKNVQCEVCHGPGSLHAAKPESVKIPVARPTAELCASCHHPPHVHTFDANAKMAQILGPGHGRPLP